jgi:aspartate beta-hydroxylase
VSLYDRVVGALRAHYDRRLATPPVLDGERWFPAGDAFRQQWRGIRCEALEVSRNLLSIPRFHDLLPDQAAISANDDRDWRMYVLKAYGVPVAANLDRCPTVAALLRHYPEVVSAAFSFLAPGKHIPEHRGPFRGILRYHLCLSVPQDGSGAPGTVMRVDGVDYRLGDGDSMLWDDTYRHEVWNHADDLRIALLLDVRRPYQPADLRLLSRVLIRAVGLGVRWRLATGVQPTVG